MSFFFVIDIHFNMKNIFKFIILLISVPIFTYASSTDEARIGNELYDTLELAIEAVKPNETITLVSNAYFKESVTINKPVKINLNNHTISADKMVFRLIGGELYLTGKGIVKEENPYYGAVVIKGSSDQNKVNFSVLEVDEDITLEGWSGVFIDQLSGKGYGIKASVNGIINALSDSTGGSGIGIYVNGNIKDKVNSPIITVNKTASINSTGNGIYQAGYARTTINGGYIEGYESSIAIKSGILTINDGEFVCNGPDKTPEASTGEIDASGVVLQIESNTSYAGNMEITINNGTFKSKNSNTIYEYSNNNKTKVISFLINNGTFRSSNGKEVFSLSQDFKDKLSPFINGGKYTTDVSKYIKNDKTLTKDDSYFKVTETVSGKPIKKSKTNTFPTYSYFLIIISILIIAIYFLKKYLTKK